MGVITTTVPEGHAISDCVFALDCIGEVAAARTAQAITASGETRHPAVVDKMQRFKFGRFAATVPVQIGDTRPGSKRLCFLAALSSFDFSTVALSASMFGEF